MRQRNTFKLLGVVVAILLMSVGYAAIENVTLTVTGNTTVTPDQGNFKVAFTGTPTKSGIGADTTTLAITDDLAATMNVSGLTAVGDTLTATFTIANTSTDITAYLSSTVTNTNTEYFEVTSALGSTELAPQTGTTTLEIKVKLIKTPVTADQTDTLTVEVIASPTAPTVTKHILADSSNRNSTCTICNEKCSHNYENIVVTTVPTDPWDDCVYTATCSNCDFEGTTSGHNFTQAGTCTICGYVCPRDYLYAYAVTYDGNGNPEVIGFKCEYHGVWTGETWEIEVCENCSYVSDDDPDGIPTYDVNNVTAYPTDGWCDCCGGSL